MPIRREPPRLRRGKEFNREYQRACTDAEGIVIPERTVTKPSGRRGRVDVFVICDDTLVGIVEAKDSDWDAMTEVAVRRNVKRQARQVLGYVESQLQIGKDVSPGIVFSRRPERPGRLQMVERLFDEEDIPVVWHDESIAERRARP